ncbi:MAG: Ig-like domain-containing protein [Clostridia bacterium]
MQFAGFFGNTYPGATIKNIGLENVDVVSGLFVGALVGGLQGSGATVSNSYVTGSVAGSTYIGGLVGYQADSSISNSYSSARVTGINAIGGLVGYQDRSSITNSYATGLVTGGNNIGGLVGISPTGEATSSFYDQSITVENSSGKGTPASTLEMHTPSTFGDWDFSSVWYMAPDQYPQLRAFLVKTPVANPDPADGPVVWGSSVAITSGTAGASIYYTTNGDDPTTSSTLYSSPFIVDHDLTMKAIAVSAGKMDSEIMSKSYTIIRPALQMGTNSGTTALFNVTDAMEYKVNSDEYTKITGTFVDNISVNVGDKIYVRLAANGQQPASDVQELTVGPKDMKPSAAATLISSIGTVSTGGTANETITNIPYGTTLAALKAAITPAAGATFEIYDADGITVARTLATGKKVIVTAQDGITKVTYTVTVKAQSPSTPVPSYYPVTDVSLDQTALNLTAGDQTAVLHATINPSYATIQSVTWSSSDPKVATVDEKGVVTPIAAGTATITVTTTDQAKTASSQVKVVEATKLVGLEVSEKTISLKPNKSSSITVQAIYSNGTKDNVTKDKEVTYLSSSRSIVTVTKGVVKAGKKEGQATITITYRDKKVEVPVWISKLDVTKLEIQPSNLQVEVGQVEQLTLTATLSNKKTQDVTEQAIWESSEPTVATIDESGKLTAMASGTTVITAAYGGKTTEITVEVNEAKEIKRLSASKQKVTVAAGKEQSIKLTATYKDHSKKVVTEQAKWSSEDETIATVNNGVIIGKAKGNVKIKAKYQGKTVTITVTVTE